MDMDMNMNTENEDLDIVVFEDDKGNQIAMQVIDYLFYEGKEYALLEEMTTEGEDRPLEAFVMEVVPIESEDEEEMEEFVPVDEALAEKLINLFENIDLEDEFIDDEE